MKHEDFIHGINSDNDCILNIMTTKTFLLQKLLIFLFFSRLMDILCFDHNRKFVHVLIKVKFSLFCDFFFLKKQIRVFNYDTIRESEMISWQIYKILD